MPTNSTRSTGPRAGRGRQRARWEEGPLGFVYEAIKDKEVVDNLTGLLKIPLVQVIVMAVVMAALAACGFVVAAMIHQPPRIRWLAGGTTASMAAAYHTARRVTRFFSELRRRRRQGADKLEPGGRQQVIGAAPAPESPSTPQPPAAGPPAGAPPPQ